MHYDVSQLHHQYILLSWIPLVAAQSIHLAHYVDSDGVLVRAAAMPSIVTNVKLCSSGTDVGSGNTQGVTAVSSHFQIFDQ